LRRQATEPGTRADDDGVLVGKILDLCDRGSLIELVVRFAGNLLGDQLWYSLDVDLGTGLARAFRDCVRHRLDVAVGRIVENENFCHFAFLTAKMRSVEWTPMGGDQDQLRILDSRDLDDGSILDGGAVAMRDEGVSREKAANQAKRR
jgi:hypothetical protein